MENKYISVTALNRYIEYKFQNDVHLQTVYLKAELSNIRLSKGILYFVLKDEDSEIDGIMFSSSLSKLKFNPIDGMTVLAVGKIGVYVKRGRYSITVFSMEEAGLGDAYLNFLRLKEELDKEGLFKAEHKLPIPKLSESIGVITSATGDALHDIVSTINNRFPLANIYLYPAIVQGADAPKSLIVALNKANQDKIVDVIIIGRGGGSVEDLSCFNDEALARAIYNSSIPTVSAVGHEADYTICDFVADLRAPTPTGAAVLITRERGDLLNEVHAITRQLNSTMKQRLIGDFNQYQSIIGSYGFKNFIELINKREERLDYLTHHLSMVSPINVIEKHLTQVADLHLRLNLLNFEKKLVDMILQIGELGERAQKALSLKLETMDKQIDKEIDKLILLNPLHVMKKGYSLTFQDKKIIRSVEEIDVDRPLVVQFAEGEAVTKVLEVKK